MSIPTNQWMHQKDTCMYKENYTTWRDIDFFKEIKTYLCLVGEEVGEQWPRLGSIISQNKFIFVWRILFTQWGIWMSLTVWKPLFLMKISQVVAFGGLGEDQNISLATESWKINNRWKTPSAVRRIAKFFTAIKTFLNNDRRCSPLLCQRFRVFVGYDAATTENLVV